MAFDLVLTKVNLKCAMNCLRVQFDATPNAPDCEIRFPALFWLDRALDYDHWPIDDDVIRDNCDDIMRDYADDVLDTSIKMADRAAKLHTYAERAFHTPSKRDGSVRILGYD